MEYNIKITGEHADGRIVHAYVITKSDSPQSAITKVSRYDRNRLFWGWGRPDVGEIPDKIIAYKCLKKVPKMTAKETEAFEIITSYDDGCCPDCGTPVPLDVANGQSCTNCPHVFCTPQPDDHEYQNTQN